MSEIKKIAISMHSGTSDILYYVFKFTKIRVAPAFPNITLDENMLHFL